LLSFWPLRARRDWHAEGSNPFLLQQLHRTIREQPDINSDSRWLSLARPTIGMDVMPGIEPMFGARWPMRRRSHFLFGAIALARSKSRTQRARLVIRCSSLSIPFEIR
jgi:hypothetical protein